MVFAFCPREQIADVVEAKAGSELSKVPGLDLETRLACGAGTPADQRDPEALVHHRPKRLSGATDLGLQPGGHVFIQGQSRSHILMLVRRHHDVKCPRPGMSQA